MHLFEDSDLEFQISKNLIIFIYTFQVPLKYLASMMPVPAQPSQAAIMMNPWNRMSRSELDPTSDTAVNSWAPLPATFP
jgi:hypothetical protein